MVLAKQASCRSMVGPTGLAEAVAEGATEGVGAAVVVAAGGELAGGATIFWLSSLLPHPRGRVRVATSRGTVVLVAMIMGTLRWQR
jgi:hypothetical protein